MTTTRRTLIPTACALAFAAARPGPGAGDQDRRHVRAVGRRRHRRHQLQERRRAGGQGDQRRRRHPRQARSRRTIADTQSQPRRGQGPGAPRRSTTTCSPSSARCSRARSWSAWPRRGAPRSPTSPAARRRRSRSRATRTSSAPASRRTTAMPKVARYIANSLKAKTVAVIFVNNDFGKGGRDAITKALDATSASRWWPTSPPNRARSTSRPPVLKAKQSNADALFVYTNEEESARALRELRKQGCDQADRRRDHADRPEGDRAGRRRRQRRGRATSGLTVDAPNPLMLQVQGQVLPGVQVHLATTTASRATPASTC